ncbi:LLM class flavin-dependent oxidoreductase [Candidatus Methylocalor cossyra]|uniref:Flavin-dependent oxidoreductase, F420-dependent methylene-tetrahydromethanopterin reductase n=1 Tax=Candidatus Methylocalor cossyra TaxID=3108543 RepID=A0ABM9NDZ6_9GAMM
MNLGIFCFYENYAGDYRKTLADQLRLVQHAEHLGFQEAWVAEHHFNDFGVSPSILLLLTHLAAHTSRIRLGTAALLLPFHDPIKVAEDIATLDQLSAGRLLLGVGRGGPFPLQNQHFRTPAAISRDKLLEALELVTRLLYEDQVSHAGTHFQCDGVTIHPKPLQRPIPVHLATQDDAGVAYAARHGLKLLGAQPWTLPQLQAVLARYRAVDGSCPASLTLLRTFFVAKTREAARDQALPALQRFSERLRRIIDTGGASWASGVKPDVEALLDNALIGDVAECRDKLQRFHAELDLAGLVLKPAALDLEANLQSLTLFNDEVRPYV